MRRFILSRTNSIFLLYERFSPYMERLVVFYTNIIRFGYRFVLVCPGYPEILRDAGTGYELHRNGLDLRPVQDGDNLHVRGWDCVFGVQVVLPFRA